MLGAGEIQRIYLGTKIIWQRGEPSYNLILPDKVNIIELIPGDIRSDTVHYFDTSKDVRNYILSPVLINPDATGRFEVVYGDALGETWYRNQFRDYYPGRPFALYKSPEYANANIVRLTMGDGFSSLYATFDRVSYEWNVTIGLFRNLRELRLPGSLTLIEDSITNLSPPWYGDALEKLYIDKPAGSIPGEPWRFHEKVQLIWTG